MEPHFQERERETRVQAQSVSASAAQKTVCSGQGMGTVHVFLVTLLIPTHVSAH